MTTKRTGRPAAKSVSSLNPHVLVLHGPNLNLLGSREPKHYGLATLDDINRALVRRGEAAGAQVETFQHNHEGALIDRVHQAARDHVDFIIINPAGYTHTSVALRDALAATAIPFIEVHLSNIYAREGFRHHSYFSDLAVGVVSGLGAHGYELALEYALRHLQNRTSHGSQKTEKTH
ncbi:MAG: type II 3-dehydroquinate dehydratase [Thiobacillus sp.]|nr:type II 3-dehydroquinate dehydratase [Thiobacillus sp.]